MLEKDDWRIRNQINYLFGVELIKTKYYSNSETWDHDHCEFCWEKFDSEEIVGYSTKDGYYWICNDCFNDFSNMFEWRVVGK